MNIYSYANIEEIKDYIDILHSSNMEERIIKNRNLSISSLNNIRRVYNIRNLKDALEMYIKNVLESEISSQQYEDICKHIMTKEYKEAIKLIPDEGLKLKYLKKIGDSSSKVKVLASLKDDSIKEEYLKSIKKEEDRVLLISSMKNDDLKFKYINSIKDFHKVSKIIESLNDDDKKLEFIYSGKVHSSMLSYVIASLKDDIQKEELLHLIPSDTGKYRVIVSMKNIERKKELFNSDIISEVVRKRKNSDFILSLPVSEQLHHFYEFDDAVKCKILMESSVSTQLKLLPEINNPKYKKEILATTNSEELLNQVMKMYSDNENFWVRTNSKDRENNVPRDDREEIITDIIRYSEVSDKAKLFMIRTHIREKAKVKELLSDYDYDTVLRNYFSDGKDSAEIDKVLNMNEIYPLRDVKNILITGNPKFDFNDPYNKKIIEFVSELDNPKIYFLEIKYDDFVKWKNAIKDTNISLKVDNLDVSEISSDLNEMNKLIDASTLFKIGQSYVVPPNYCSAYRMLDEVLANEEYERKDLLKTKFAIALGSNYVGSALKELKRFFDEYQVDKDTSRRIGENVFSALYYDIYKSNNEPKLILGFDEEAVKIVNEWDQKGEALTTDFPKIVDEMTKGGIRTALEINEKEGNISRDFAIGFLLKYMGMHNPKPLGIKHATRVIEELMDVQDVQLEDIKTMKPGSYSDVYKVGEYVVKIGSDRITKILPEHESILPSLLRFEINEDKQDTVAAFVEVQPYVKSFDDIFIEDELQEIEIYNVYKKLRDKGIYWGDVAKRNLGYIEKKIEVPSELFEEYKDELKKDPNIKVYHSEKPFVSPKVSKDIDCEFFVLDTDFLYQIRNDEEIEDLLSPSFRSGEYEILYQKEKKKDNKKNNEKNNKRNNRKNNRQEKRGDYSI